MKIPTITDIKSYASKLFATKVTRTEREWIEVFWATLLVSAVTLFVCIVIFSLSLWWVTPDTTTASDVVESPAAGSVKGYDPLRAEKVIDALEGR
jgi:ABC-type sulfate transport system permease component